MKTLDQQNLLWRTERKFRITASECYKLFTANKNRNTVWESKMQLYFKPKPNLKNFSVGRDEEEKAIKLYESQSKNKVIKIGLVVHPSCPWLGCSPDGFVSEKNTVVEVKTLINNNNLPFHDALNEAKYLGKRNGSFFLKEKHLYHAQIQINMHLLRASKADLVIYNYRSSQIEILSVNYNQKFVLELVESLKSVYFSHVLSYVFQHFLTETDQNKYV